MKRIMVALLCAALAYTAFAAGGQDSGAAKPQVSAQKGEGRAPKYHAPLGVVPMPSKQYRVGVLVKTLINDFWLDLKNGYEAAGKDYGVKVDVYAAPGEGDILVQKSILDNMIAQKYDVIIVSPITDTNLISGLQQATKQGIPLLNVIDSYISPEAQSKHGIKIASFMTTDFVEHSRKAVDFVATKLGTQGGEVIHIMGLPGNPSAEDRKKGYEQGMAKYPQLKNVGIFPGDWDRKKAMDVAADAIQRFPRLRAITASNDTMAMGALQAVKNAGKLGQIEVVGVDAIPDAIRAIMDGELGCTVAFFQYQVAYTAIEAAIQIMEGTFDETKNKEVKLGVEVWDQSNIKDKVALYKDQYTGLKDF